MTIRKILVVALGAAALLASTNAASAQDEWTYIECGFVFRFNDSELWLFHDLWQTWINQCNGADGCTITPDEIRSHRVNEDGDWHRYRINRRTASSVHTSNTYGEAILSTCTRTQAPEVSPQQF